MRQALSAIRAGNRAALEGRFPREIEPLVKEMTALIDNNRRIVERSRTQVGNLAHSLKTPIAVLINESRDMTPAHSALVRTQAETMQAQVQTYLDRARIAAHGQHVERWKIARDAYPEGRTGYLKWRTDQAKAHAERVSGMMAEAGYDEEDRARVESLLRKEGIKRNPEMQQLEDVICFVFIRWYLADFAATRKGDELERIVEKTARKMSPEARARALSEFDMPAALAGAFAD